MHPALSVALSLELPSASVDAASALDTG
jgi:hypothetical protein